MALLYSDDLRCKLLEAYEAGVGSLRESANQFRVSWGYSKKVRAHQVRTGYEAQKKSLHAVERDTATNLQRQVPPAGQPDRAGKAPRPVEGADLPGGHESARHGSHLDRRIGHRWRGLSDLSCVGKDSPSLRVRSK